MQIINILYRIIQKYQTLENDDYNNIYEETSQTTNKCDKNNCDKKPLIFMTVECNISFVVEVMAICFSLRIRFDSREIFKYAKRKSCLIPLLDSGFLLNSTQKAG